MGRDMPARLHERVVVVVGAGSGIGAAVARRVAAEGARVAVCDVNLAAAEAVAAGIGEAAAAFAIDVADPGAVDAAFGAIAARFGRIDAVHSNAADMRAIHLDSNAIDVDLAVFDRTIAVNLRGGLLVTRAALPHLLAAGGGALVYTSSDAADAGETERPAYAMAKSGLNALMRHVASRWGPQGITANCIAPGFVMTPELEAGGAVPPEFIAGVLRHGRSPRLGAVEDIAAMVAHLVSADGAWINGQVLRVNGGTILS